MIDDITPKQFLQNPEVSPHNIIYTFEHLYPRVEVQVVSQKMEAQNNFVEQLANNFNDIWSRVDSLTEKKHLLGGNQDN